MIKLGRKGTIGTLTSIIVVLLIFVALVIVYLKVNASLSQKADREVCRASVLAQVAGMSVLTSVGESIDLSCKTYNVVFFNDRVEINGKKINVYDSRTKSSVKKFSGLTDEIVNEVTAEELRWCWYQFLEGNKRKMFTAKNLISANLDRPELCFLCDEVSFDQPSVKKESFSGFYQYTKDTKMPLSNMTYYEYYAEQPRVCDFAKYTDVPCWEAYFKDHITGEDSNMVPEKTIFNKNSTYAVVFVKSGKAGRILQLIKSGEAYFSYVVPANFLNTQCDSMLRGPMK
jgi:hypothetical protein